MPQETLPTHAQIDSLAALYIDAQAAVELARDRESALRQQLTEMVERHGSVPRRALKSKRLEGDEYQATLSKGHSVEVMTARVELFRQWMKAHKLTSLFRKLFKRETVYVLREYAQELVNTMASGSKHRDVAADLCSLFHQSLDIKDNSPYLKVEPKNKEKKKEAAA
jgi:hypothetical protein